jgi:hypothetical protein
MYVVMVPKTRFPNFKLSTKLPKSKAGMGQLVMSTFSGLQFECRYFSFDISDHDTYLANFTASKGRFYDHNFRRFWPIFGEEIGAIFGPFFGENMFKIITSVPCLFGFRGDQMGRIFAL